MEVILLEKVANLGNLGDRVKGRPGYGRNFLVPSKKGVPADEQNIAEFEARRAELEKAAAEALAEAQARAEKIAAVEQFTIKAIAGDEGKLFGSVGVIDIVEAAKQAGIEVERREVSLPEQIRNVGEYDLTFILHSDVSVPVHLVVEAE